ncbi:MAG: nitroreductase [Anaerolineaceae bacterium]|nr:nitroreductase [Anaerolineaceae bacterium]
MTAGIGKEFMRKTKPQFLEESLQDQGQPQPPLEKNYDPAASLIPLPEVDNLPSYGLDLRQAIEQRKTLRKYQQQALTLDELTFLLWTTQGVKSVTKRPVTLRTVPSAGARHAFETYVLVNRVEGIQPGLYRYVALEHALLPVNLSEEINSQITRACYDQSQVFNSAVTFIWVTVLERMYWRYGERGYRYLHLDAGHVCQNLYLAAEAIQSGVCAIAAFNDDEINQVMGLDGENQFVIYLGSVGKR